MVTDSALQVLTTQPRSQRTIEISWGTLFILPWILGFILITAVPMLATLYLSFTNYSLVNPETSQWVGTSNYQDILGIEFKTLSTPSEDASKLLDPDYVELGRIRNVVIGARDPDFWTSLAVTLLFGAIMLPVGLVCGLGLAYLLNMKIPGVRVFRTIIYSPMMIPGVVTAIVFSDLLDKNTGWINAFLKVFGIVGPDWLNRAQWMLPSLALIGLWSIGGSMMVYLVGLQNIPTELYEAAMVDGATIWVRFWRITLPLLTPVILYDLVLGLIGLFQYFLLPYILTDGSGGPNKSADFYALNVYHTAFAFGKMGYASALSWILFVIVLAITVIIFTTSGNWVFYSGRSTGRQSNKRGW